MIHQFSYDSDIFPFKIFLSTRFLSYSQYCALFPTFKTYLQQHITSIPILSDLEAPLIWTEPPEEPRKDIQQL
jgi:hypothetical protein